MLFTLVLAVAVSTCSCDSSTVDSTFKNDNTTTGDAAAGGARKAASHPLNWMASANWEVVSEYMFEDHGSVLFGTDQIVLNGGDPATGIRFRGVVPRDSYEVTFEAQRLVGSDFFCGLTFPIGDEHCTLVLGGWSGTIVGLSNVDDEPAVENLTATSIEFENECWYSVRVVVDKAIHVWIADRKVIELERGGHRFTLWWEQEEMAPFGIATWGGTTGIIRELRVRKRVSTAQPL